MITYATISKKGNRSINEDSIGAKINGDSACFVVADGLGGHGKGEVASQIVVEKAMECYNSNNTGANFISRTFEKAQIELLESQRKAHVHNEMKTTMVLCSICDKMLKWGHIGDSRLYIFNRGWLKRRTLDHSVPQMLVLAHEIKEKDIRFHPDRNRLLKVMGTRWEKPEYELGEEMRITSKISLLICTDGFWELIDEKTMKKCLCKASDVQEWLNNMVEIVEQNGQNKDMDNYSAICIWCR